MSCYNVRYFNFEILLSMAILLSLLIFLNGNHSSSFLYTPDVFPEIIVCVFEKYGFSDPDQLWRRSFIGVYSFVVCTISNVDEWNLDIIYNITNSYLFQNPII